MNIICLTNKKKKKKKKLEILFTHLPKLKL